MADLRFVRSSNLPENMVKCLILGEKYAKILSKKFSELDIELIIVPENRRIAPNIAFHADMSVFHAGGAKLVAARAVYNDLLNLVNLGFELTCADSEQGPEYPRDIGLNACAVGGRLLHNLRHTDAAVLRAADENGLIRCNVSQGYAKCAVCVVDENRMITADAGIHKAAGALGINSLLISHGGIALSGCDSGFIGGSSVKLSRGVLAFTGRLDGHPDERRIMDFLSDAGVRPLYLSDEPIFDAGSMLPVLERA